MKDLYTNNIINSKERITEQDLLKIERKYHFNFPLDIRKHYLNYNGGTLEKEIFTDKDNHHYAFNWFIPIKSEERNISTVLDLLRDDPILPDWLIPFADDPGGDLFCFSLKEEEKGSIYYWSHEYEYGENAEEYAWKIADNIMDFINSMEEETE